MSRTRYKIYDDNYPYFLTSTIVGWLPIFMRPALANIILDSLRFLSESKRMNIFSYVLMENHIHLIASAEDLSKEMGDFKSFTARRIIDHCTDHEMNGLLKNFHHLRKTHKHDRDYQVWQEGSHPLQITSDEMMRQKTEYIHSNPLRRGYIDKPSDWRYSSARDYEGTPGIVPVITKWY